MMATNTNAEQVLAVHRIYVKSSLFEPVQMNLKLLKEPPSPVIDMEVFVDSKDQGDNNWEAILTLQLTAKENGNLLWRLQLQQAGLYLIKGFTEEQQTMILKGYCMNQLYVHASETICNMVIKGGFPPVYSAPMDFEMIYREQQQKQKNELADRVIN